MTNDQLLMVSAASDLYRSAVIGADFGEERAALFADRAVLEALLLLAEAAPSLLEEIERLGGVIRREVTLQ